MARIKFVFYLPIRDNDGRDLRPDILAVEEELFNRFNGWAMTGPVRGAYRMADRTPAYDDLLAYAVVADESRVPELREVVAAFKAKTTQEAIYTEVQYNLSVDFL